MKKITASMNPFKIKIPIDQFENMGYILKSGDTLYQRGRDGNYQTYGVLTKFDTECKCWLAKSASMKSFPVTKVNHYIDIVVIPFEQYVRKVSDRANIKKS